MAFDTFLPFTFKPDNTSVTLNQTSSTTVSYTVPAGFYAYCQVAVSMAMTSTSTNIRIRDVGGFSGYVEGNNIIEFFYLWLSEGDTITTQKSADGTSSTLNAGQQRGSSVRIQITPNGGSLTNYFYVTNRAIANNNGQNATNTDSIGIVASEYALP